MTAADAERTWSRLMAAALVVSAAGIIALATQITSNPPPPTEYDLRPAVSPDCSHEGIYWARRALSRMERDHARSDRGEYREWLATEILKKRSDLEVCGVLPPSSGTAKP